MIDKVDDFAEEDSFFDDKTTEEENGFSVNEAQMHYPRYYRNSEGHIKPLDLESIG